MQISWFFALSLSFNWNLSFMSAFKIRKFKNHSVFILYALISGIFKLLLHVWFQIFVIYFYFDLFYSFQRSCASTIFSFPTWQRWNKCEFVQAISNLCAHASQLNAIISRSSHEQEEIHSRRNLTLN